MHKAQVTAIELMNATPVAEREGHIEALAVDALKIKYDLEGKDARSEKFVVLVKCVDNV